MLLILSKKTTFKSYEIKCNKKIIKIIVTGLVAAVDGSTFIGNFRVFFQKEIWYWFVFKLGIPLTVSLLLH